MYTPVPAVSAGDWIDEVFINTYWVDNFAAGVPDLFSAKGQLPVGLGVDSMGVLSVGADGKVLMANAAAALGMDWVYAFSTGWRYANPAYAGAAIPIGNTLVNISSWGITNPTPPIRAIVARLSTRWAAAADGSTFQLQAADGNLYLVARALVANIFVDTQGIVPVNSSGQFRIVVGGAATTATYLDILGWFQ